MQHEDQSVAEKLSRRISYLVGYVIRNHAYPLRPSSIDTCGQMGEKRIVWEKKGMAWNQKCSESSLKEW